MSEFPRFAPYTLPDRLDRILWYVVRIAPLVFLFGVVGVTFIGMTRIAFWLVILSGVAWFLGFVLRWALHRFWPD